jgi:hypothetical protein
MAQETIPGATPTPPVGQENAGQVAQSTETSQEVKQVPLAALEAERNERQRAQREADVLRRKTELLEQAAAQNAQPKYDPEDIPSFKDVVNIVDDAKNQMLEKTRQAQIEMQVNQVRQKFSDYDDVCKLASEMAENNPGMASVIMNSANPPMTAYDYGRLHPSYKDKEKQKVTQELADKINNNLNSQKTLSDAGGGGNPSVEKDYRALAGTPEFKAYIEKVKLKRR